MNRLTLTLGSSFALLVALTIVTFSTTPDMARLAADLQQSDTADASDPAFNWRTLPGRQSLRETVDRSLFTTTRKGPPETPAKPAAPDTKSKATASREVLDRLTLVGTIVQGDRLIALVEEQGKPETLYLSAGDTVLGWTVETVSASKLTFSAGTDQADLEFPVASTQNP